MKYSQREFAKIIGVSRDTLRRWEELGIFSPMEKNGERKPSFYSEEQIAQAKKIPLRGKKSLPYEVINLFDTDTAKATDTLWSLIPSLSELNDVEDFQAVRADSADATPDDDSYKDDQKERINSGDLSDGEVNTENILANLPKRKPHNTRDILAKLAGVSSRTFGKVEKIEKLATAEIKAALRASELSIDAAYKGVLAGATTVDEVKEFNRQKSTTTPAPVETSETPITIELAPVVVTLEERANKIRQLQADVQRGIIEIGFELIAAKKEIGHGKWGDWLQAEFDWTDRTARNFMAVAERFGNRKTFSDLKPSTLQAMLRLPNGDEDKFIEAQAEAGKPVEKQSAREVQEAVKQWNERKAEDTAPETVSSFEASSEQCKLGGEYFGVWKDSLPQADEEPITKEITPDADKKKLAPIAHNFNGSAEWYTPSEYIEAAKRVMGDIDLDPASSTIANETVKAKKFFSADDNGLIQDWSGRIWLNPPFASGLIEKFIDKLLASDFEAAIVLVDNATETRWFRKLADSSSAIVFTTGRINFLKGGTYEAGTPTRGQCFFYFGSEPNKFFATFQQFGWCAKSITTVTNPK